jgi:hypothetical protein
MKRVLLSIIVLFGVTTIASAQTTKNNNASNAKTVTGSGVKNKKINNASVNYKTDTITLTNREIYHWSDGQRATPTGQEATSSNGSGYAALKKDTAKVIGKGKQQ